MTARKLGVTVIAALALAVPAAQACNITADLDHAVRMTQGQPARTVLSSVKTSSQWLTKRRLTPADPGAHRVGDPWPSSKPAVTSPRLRDYPR
jgi:hypothetical protein